MIGEPTEIFRVYQDYDLDPFGGLAIRYGCKNSDGSVNLAEPIRMLRHDPDKGIATQPMMIIQRPAAQMLMDELWKSGIRPSSIGTAGHLASIQAHLNDMRKIVFDSLLEVKR